MKLSTKLSKKLCIVAVLFAGSVFMAAAAADFMVDSICYNITSDNEVEVTKLTSGKYSGVVIIPSTVIQNGTTYQVTRIGENAFSGCRELTLVDLPEGILSIGTNGFYDCTALEAIEYPNSLESIENLAFCNCTNLTTVNITRNITDIGSSAFNNCTGLTSISCSPFNQHFKADGGILYTKDMTMLVLYPKNAVATSFTIPDGVTALESYAFQNCDNLTDITFPESVTWLGRDVFWRCEGLVSIDLPDGITHMGKGTFDECVNLVQVHLPASLDSILDFTFYSCKLQEITIPQNLKHIGQYAFSEAKELHHVNFEEGSNLLTIDENAFFNCYALESFDMPNSVTSLKANAFYQCRSLKSIHLSDNLTDLGKTIFWYCSSLTELKVPNGVPRILNSIVHYCTALRTLRIGDRYGIPGTTTFESSSISADSIVCLELGANVAVLGNYAMWLNPDLKVFICWAPIPPTCTNNSFGVYPSATLYVPKASLEAYSTAAKWKDFSRIVPIDDLGDVNGDQAVNMDDLTMLINVLLGSDISFNTPLADSNLDGEVNMDDLTALINILLNNN